MKKKTLAILICAVMLLAGVAATLAYFTSVDTAKNTFTSGKVEILLDEADVDDSTDGVDRDKANRYEDIIPGHEYAKDPTVTVKAGSEDCYVRMFVTIDKQVEFDAIFDGSVDLSAFFPGYDGSIWLYKGYEKSDDGATRTYEFWYKDVVAENADADTVLPALFTGVVIPGEYTTVIDGKTVVKNIGNAEMESIDGFTIDVVAHAIQKDGFATPELAWAAFDRVSN